MAEELSINKEFRAFLGHIENLLRREANEDRDDFDMTDFAESLDRARTNLLQTLPGLDPAYIKNKYAHLNIGDQVALYDAEGHRLTGKIVALDSEQEFGVRLLLDTEARQTMQLRLNDFQAVYRQS